MFKPKLAVAMVLLLLTCAAAVIYRDSHREPVSSDTISLLLPDSANEKDTQVQAWIDAAQEEGLHLHIIRDSVLLDPMFKIRSAGLIIPDQVHRQANDALIGALHKYVEQGGKLMIVYDACTWDLHDRYADHASRLSDLVGVDYALYDRFGTASIASGSVWGTTLAMHALAIPPGSYIAKEMREKSPLQKVAFRSGPVSGEDRQVLVGYLYGELEYPSFQTAGEFQGKTLLQSATGLVAGETKHGTGDVLFVNLPLGYLETRTDGMLLHSFVRYFALHTLHLPYLAPVPDGIGGVVMNWHIDAASALKPMAVLRTAGIFDYGPFSADFTAGPDVDEFKDGQGLNLRGNAVAQSWVRFLREHGDEVGSHGGWIHNYFGKHLSESNQDSFQKYLLLNKQAIEAVGEGSVTEYSAPLGNHPEWVTRWLENNGIVAYYFTGDAGLGPTRVYRDQGREGDKIWAFPILHFGQEASLEEMHMDSVPESEVKNWLFNVSDFTSSLHVVRLVYSHPIGAAGYLNALRPWFQHTHELDVAKEFRWYTMSQVANFLNARQETSWTLEDQGTHSMLKASHPQTLQHQAWMLPDEQYDKPRVVEGSADIRDQDGYWIVAANHCKHLKLLTERRADTNPHAPH
ncbi:MAG TPA: hypothetical protein VG498_02940 [Terriglobales bacterium]|nr:hypothetical protein [Terriglobales bacterium]